MENFIKEVKKRAKIRVVKKQSLSFSKKLLRSLTTNQLLLLLPSIIDKIVKNNNVPLTEDVSDQTEFSVFTSDDCLRSSRDSLSDKISRDLQLCCNANHKKSQKNWMSLPTVTENFASLSAENTFYKSDSIFGKVNSSKSNNGALNKLKKYAKCITVKSHKEVTKTANDTQEISNTDIICEELNIIPKKYENYVSERNLMETVTTNTPPQEFYFEINQISQSTFDEYIEFVIVDEFCLVDFYINNVAKHVLNLPSKQIKIYTSELIKYSYNYLDRVSSTENVSQKLSDIYFEKLSLKENQNSLQKDTFVPDSSQFDSINSLEIKIDACEEQSVCEDEKTLTKSNTSIERDANNFVFVLDENNESTTTKQKSKYLIQDCCVVKSSLNVSSALLASKNHGFEINQKGDTKQINSDKSIRNCTENIDPIKSIHESERLLPKQTYGILFPSRNTKIRTVQSFSPQVKKINLNGKTQTHVKATNSIQKKLSSSSTSKVLNVSKSSGKIHSIEKAPLCKSNRETDPKTMGLSTSKVINGRFQHGWHCTYKTCLTFNSLQRQVCRNCLNPRWCHPPLCRRDVICADCGYINYKSRLYCKKCKFLFVNFK